MRVYLLIQPCEYEGCYLQEAFVFQKDAQAEADKRNEEEQPEARYRYRVLAFEVK